MGKNKKYLAVQIIVDFISLIVCLFLYRNQSFPRILGAVAVHQLILSLLLNTLWISLLYGSPYAPLLLSRLPQCAILAAVQLAVIPLIAHILPQIRGGAA